MRVFIVLSILSFSMTVCNSLFSQKKAVTENGDEVILFDDGTWQ